MSPGYEVSVSDASGVREVHTAPDLERTVWLVENLLRCQMPVGWTLSVRQAEDPMDDEEDCPYGCPDFPDDDSRCGGCVRTCPCCGMRMDRPEHRVCPDTYR